MKGHSSENSTVVLYQVNSAHKNGLQVCVSLWRLGRTLPEAEAFVCVLLWNGKVCDSEGTDLLYGARSNWPFLSTQELEWWLIQQYNQQGDWFCEDLLGIIVLLSGRHPDSLQRQQAARAGGDTVSILTIVTAWWAQIFLSTCCGICCASSIQKLGFLGASVETPNYPDVWRVLCGKP